MKSKEGSSSLSAFLDEELDLDLNFNFLGFLFLLLDLFVVRMVLAVYALNKNKF